MSKKIANHQTHYEQESDFDDEEEEYSDSIESDDSEEEEEYEPVKKKSKAKKQVIPRNEFVDDVAAEADEDEDEYEDDEAEDGFLEASASSSHQSSARSNNDQRAHNYRKQDTRSHLEVEKSLQEYANRLEDQEQHQYSDDEGSEYGDDIIEHTQLGPLQYWCLKCKIGEEHVFVAQMMQKFFNHANNSNAQGTETKYHPLLIKSVMAPHHLPGHIYIEATRETHVKQAIRGMHQLVNHTATIIPMKDITDILSASGRKTLDLPRGTWIRVRLGRFKDDIGQIMDYEPERGRCTVKLIPRMDLSNPTSSNSDNTIRPQQRFFNAKDLQQMGHQIPKKQIGTNVYYLFNNDKYRHGFVYKQMRIKSITSDSVVPSLEELAKFQDKQDDDNDDDKENRMLNGFNVIPRLAPRTLSFSKGDAVKVIDGDLKNLMGIVETVDDKSVTIMPLHEGLHDLLEFQPTELQKHFKIGDHVKVIAGRFDGETGLVVRVEDITATLLSDLSMSEIKVRPQDLQECTEIATGMMELGNLELYDLVQITPQKVGVIIKVERDSFKILDENSYVTTVKLQEVGAKRRFKSTTLDAHNNTVGQTDAVEVIDGQHRGKQGTVLHVSRTFLFLKSKTHVYENGGRGRGRGGRGGGGRGGFDGGSGSGRGTRDDGPLHKVVTIKSGSWKGYTGIVRQVTDSMVQIELQSNSKRVNIQRDNILMPGERANENSYDNQFSYSGRSPTHNSNEYPSMTPMRHETPSMTPMHNNEYPAMAPMPHENPTMMPIRHQAPTMMPIRHQTPTMTPMRHESLTMTPMRNNDVPSMTPMRNTADAWATNTPMRPAGGTSMGSSWYDEETSTGDRYRTTPSIYSPYSMFTPQSHQDHYTSMMPTPTNAFDAPTPSYTSFEPPTPIDSVATPSTPAPVIDDQEDEYEGVPFQGDNIEVVFKQGTEHAGQHGVIIENIDSVCRVQLIANQKIINDVSQDALDMAPLSKKDHVLIINGPYLLLETGTLFVISQPGDNKTSGIVKMDSNMDFKVFKLAHLGKIYVDK
eukprot:gene7654-8958_t